MTAQCVGDARHGRVQDGGVHRADQHSQHDAGQDRGALQAHEPPAGIGAAGGIRRLVMPVLRHGGFLSPFFDTWQGYENYYQFCRKRRSSPFGDKMGDNLPEWHPFAKIRLSTRSAPFFRAFPKKICNSSRSL